MKVNIGKYPKSDKTERKIKIEIDDYDTWDAYTTLSYIIHPLLVRYKEKNDCHPGNLTEEEWDIILDKMIHSFYCIMQDMVWKHMGDQEYNSRIQEGLDLFAKHFRNIWI